MKYLPILLPAAIAFLVLLPALMSALRRRPSGHASQSDAGDAGLPVWTMFDDGGGHDSDEGHGHGHSDPGDWGSGDSGGTDSGGGDSGGGGD